MIYSPLPGIKCHPLRGKARKAVFSVSICDSKTHFPDGVTSVVGGGVRPVQKGAAG